tara:strand:+ start:699 stop:914 length:216 start_codon:yes stop_codon:yes gene_type:complete
MKNQERIWLKDAVERAIYLDDLGVSLMKIREEILKSQNEHFWGNQRRLLIELILNELPSRQFSCEQDEIPF